jgi:DNA-binding transcriptional MerR regulator
MNTLQSYAQSQSHWTLEEFVQVTNSLLPQFLPELKAKTRVREEVTPRLVRHYGTLNMLDEPVKSGREVRYTYRHLLQMLVVRRLLIEGHSAGAIDQLATSSSNADLEALLQGGVQLAIAPANPALAHLQRIQERQSPEDSALTVLPILEPAQPPSINSVATTYQWTRMEVLPSLELHVRDDFEYPTSPQEQENLLQYLKQKLITYMARRSANK